MEKILRQYNESGANLMTTTHNSQAAYQPHLRIVRRFAVPAEVVFNTLTNPNDMPIWWGNDATFDIDLRVGGHWTIVRREGETVYTATGEYLAIERPHWLQYTFAMPQFSPNRDTISFQITPEEAGCVVTFVQAGEDTASELGELAPGATSASEAGWQQGFDLMAAAWAMPA
jgi:uncharacterized protein YndB with AHSA1/START domain